MAEQTASDSQQQEVTPAEVGALDVGQTAEPFFRFQYLDGDEKVFNTTEDLQQGFRKSYLRGRDLERERAQMTKDRSSFEKEMADMKSEREHERSTVKEYLEWDQRIKADPRVYAQIKSVLDGGTMYDRGVPAAQDSSYGDEVRSLREEVDRMKRVEADSRAESAWSGNSSKYSDFDRDAVEHLLARAREGDESELVEILHHATKGYSLNGSLPGDVKKKLESEKSLADLAPSGAAPSSSGPSTYGSAQEAHDAAIKALGISQ